LISESVKLFDLSPSLGTSVFCSIFVRDCHDCKLVTACQQFRSRDCSRMDICLFCVTQPIIESSTTMRFSCFQYHYPQLQGLRPASFTTIAFLLLRQHRRQHLRADPEIDGWEETVAGTGEFGARYVNNKFHVLNCVSP